MIRPPFDVRPAKFKHDNPFNIKGYWLKLYIIFDGENLNYFTTQSDWLDNMCMAKEMNIDVTNFTHDLLVTNLRHVKLFNMIEDYVQSSRVNSQSEL